MSKGKPVKLCKHVYLHTCINNVEQENILLLINQYQNLKDKYKNAQVKCLTTKLKLPFTRMPNIPNQCYKQGCLGIALASHRCDQSYI